MQVTKKEKARYTKNWLGTQYDLDFDWRGLVENGTLKYVAYGVERCPKTDRPHQ